MNIPTDLQYTKDHEWIRREDDLAVLGITDFAQGELGDIIFVEFPDVGATFKQGEVFGTVEAVKTVADLFMPVAGEVVEVNSGLEDNPEQVNSDPYGLGWMVKVRIADSSQLDDLMGASEYKELVA
ncbi:MAG: glycine cleavage system protein GcvH [Candidatus Marinimicrobia bacterium]|nr:glycine cleavage system protein GcvH [Candidatus Neomarinimicrobiota bacterium]MCH8024529.1 glycine cleavage system protein GcvH [Candidatus Neomarinimicrobiota bacterium]